MIKRTRILNTLSGTVVTMSVFLLLSIDDFALFGMNRVIALMVIGAVGALIHRETYTRLRRYYIKKNRHPVYSRSVFDGETYHCRGCSR